MQNNSGLSLQEKIATMMETNLELSEEILKTTKKVQRYVLWLKVINIIKILLIVVPIVYGIWFLRPYLSQMSSVLDLYGAMFGLQQSAPAQQAATTSDTNTVNTADILDQLKGLDQSQLQELLGS